MKLGLSIAVLAASALAGACFAQAAPAASPTAAQSTTPAANTTPASAAKPMKHGYDPNTVICKWTEEIGTRLGGGKTCMTRAQWDQLSRDSQDELNDTTQHGREMGPPGN
jgi:invasion protein IalB